MLANLEQQPADALLALIKLHNTDPRVDKIDLGVGVYRTGQGETPVFGAIKAAEQLLVDTSDKGFRQRFARIAAQREADLRQSLAKAGVDALELSTDGDLVDCLTRFIDLRKRRARASGGGRLPAHLAQAA